MSFKQECRILVFSAAFGAPGISYPPQHSRLLELESVLLPRPPNVPLLRALWSLLDGIWGLLKGSLGGAGEGGFTVGLNQDTQNVLRLCYSRSLLVLEIALIQGTGSETALFDVTSAGSYTVLFSWVPCFGLRTLQP